MRLWIRDELVIDESEVVNSDIRELYGSTVDVLTVNELNAITIEIRQVIQWIDPAHVGKHIAAAVYRTYFNRVSKG